MKKYLVYLFIVFGISFLFNYSVNATTITTTNKGVVIDENYIYNKFVAIGNDPKINKPFDINQYSYIGCSLYDKTTNNNLKYLHCYAFENSGLDYIVVRSQSSYKELLMETGSDAYYFKLNFYSGNLVQHEYIDAVSWPTQIYTLNNYDSSLTTKNSFTNFKYLNSETDAVFSNNLNFTKYMEDLTFDDNLFANDDNFKKVCVNSNSSFSITKNHNDGVMSGSDHDFIWFPYGIRGIKQFNYSTEMSNGYYEFEDPYENFYFSSYDNINAIWDTEYMQGNFESKGYTDKYKYYGYTAYLFLHWYNFNEGQTYNFFPIFELTNDLTTTHISSSGNIVGGGGIRLDDDEDIEISREYCFYIKKEYEVNEVILDEWGDHYTSVNTPNGTINYGTSVNKDNTNSESFLSQPIKFISEMSGTLAFLNANIYNLYISMPLIMRMFLITSLIIFTVILIMKIGGYK